MRTVARCLFKSLVGEHHVSRNPCQLVLYITGDNTKAQEMTVTLQQICEQHLNGNHGLHIVDVSRQPDVAQREGVFVTPCLDRILPQPRRRLIGDFLDVNIIVKKLALGAFLDK